MRKRQTYEFPTFDAMTRATFTRTASRCRVHRDNAQVRILARRCHNSGIVIRDCSRRWRLGPWTAAVSDARLQQVWLQVTLSD
jgi:hypothetical protein